MMTPFISLILCSSPIAVNTSLPADQISAFSLFLSFSLSVYKSIGAFRPHSCFPVTIQINLDQSFRLNLFLSYLQRIAFLGELLGQRSRHESLRRPLIEPVRRHDVPNTFGSYESRDFRTRKNPSVNRLSTAVSGATACSCISLQRPEEQSILSGLQSRTQYVVFSLGKSVYRKGLLMTRHY